MVSTARQRFSFQEYLALEEIAAVRHEFLAGTSGRSRAGRRNTRRSRRT